MVCLAGILISLVVGSFCVVTYGASAGEADGSESEQVDTSGNPTSDVEDGLTGTTGGYAEQEDGDLPIHSMFDQCRKVFCQAIRECAEKQPGVIRVDMLKTRVFGNKIYVDLEIGADGNETLRDAHAVAERVHDHIEKEFPKVKHIMVHVNPA